MNESLYTAQILASNGGGGGTAGLDPFLLIMIAILVLFMVMTFRRGKKMRDAQASAISGALPGAEVVSAGGLVGTVVVRDEERQRVTLEFSSGDRADFQLTSIQHVVTPATAPEDPAAGSAADEDR